MLPFWAVALFGFGIVARVTRFLNSDYLFEPVRDWLERKTGAGKLYYLVTCPWCASIWVAAPVAAIAAWPLSSLEGRWAWTAFVGLWFGWSYLYGRLAMTEDDE